MRQVTTPTTLPNAERNALVVAANIPCQANGCERKATRWSNLCGLCEKQFLEDMKPVFGKPSKDQLTVAQKVIRDHYDTQIKAGVFDDWSSQIGRAFARPLSKLVSPLGMRRYRTPKERFAPLLALRTRDRGVLTRKGVINLLAYALAIDALITPTIPQPVRNDYMIALLGQRLGVEARKEAENVHSKNRTVGWKYRAPEKNGAKRTPGQDIAAAKMQRSVNEAALIQRNLCRLRAAKE